AKDLEQSVYSWDSSNMADGKYEIKVTASDAPSNPAKFALTGEKQSDPFIVDNTGPETQNFQTPKPGTLRFSVKDTVFHQVNILQHRCRQVAAGLPNRRNQ
ncbi:MAG: hypothetical protein GXO75_11345, partial [Calditrichaeota bacterium]|nr:hypothetical protein [Calditrichota bacterium]